MQTLTDIWERRLKTIQDHSISICGFSEDTIIKASTPYGANYKDYTVQDFRDVINSTTYGELSKYLQPESFSLQPIYTNGHVMYCLQRVGATDLTLIATVVENQTQCTIYTHANVYSVSWYKQRGSIDSIINTEYGQAITRGELTDLLVLLGLETEYELTTAEEN